MNYTNKTYFIVISVVLSLVVHLLVFTVSRNITFRSMFIQESSQKPTRYLKLGTVSMKSPEIEKPSTVGKAQLIR